MLANPSPSIPAWYIHHGMVPSELNSPVPFSMLLNLASVINANSSEILWGFLQRYSPEVTPDTHPLLSQLVNHAVVYFQDFVASKNTTRIPTPQELEILRSILANIRIRYSELSGASTSELYEILKEIIYCDSENNNMNFLYQVLLGQATGPCFARFGVLYGIDKIINLVERCLEQLDIN
jgi:lysyl-tRNA synthetase class 1